MPSPYFSTPDLTSIDSLDWEAQAKLALWSNDASTLRELLEQKGLQFPDVDIRQVRGLYVEALMYEQSPYNAIGVIFKAFPPKSDWLVGLIIRSNSNISNHKIGELTRWWMTQPGLSSQQIDDFARATFHGLFKDLHNNPRSMEHFSTLFGVWEDLGYDWKNACGQKSLGLAILISVLFPNDHDMISGLNRDELKKGYTQLLGLKSCHSALWGMSSKNEYPHPYINAWDNWMQRDPVRVQAWEDLIQEDARHKHCAHEWMGRWFQAGRLVNSALVDWRVNGQGNPFDDPLFMGDRVFPQGVDLSDLTLNNTYDLILASPQELIHSLVKDLTEWVQTTKHLTEEQRKHIIAAIENAPASKINFVAPDIISLAAYHKSPWFIKMVEDPNVLPRIGAKLSESRTCFHFLCDLTPTQINFIASKNKDFWSEWKDDQGANLLLAYHKITGISMPDNVSQSLYENYPHWFIQPDENGMTVIDSEAITYDFRVSITQKLLTDLAGDKSPAQAPSKKPRM